MEAFCMPSIRKRADNGLLFFDFRVKGKRCREQTLLPDTPPNRKKLEKVLAKIDEEIRAGTFLYEAYFPNSKALQRLGSAASAPQASVAAAPAIAPASEAPSTPTFEKFANQWVDERSIEWRRSHIKSLTSTLNGRLIPKFGQKAVGSITKSEILAFRAELAKVPGRGTKEGLSPKRINEIVGVLCQIVDEAADRLQFTAPTTGIKRLRARKSDVNPFSLTEVQTIIATVRVDFREYFTVRFFTGMRTGEVHGLKWKYVDFERGLILVRETVVLGEADYTKTDGSQREIQMSQPVREALQRQFAVTGKLSTYVFCNHCGEPLDNKNFSDRIWYPLLRYLELEPRRPYQMRHTAATLWLASGEAPEWIARQLGHTSTEMLFRVYSRYVPNLTRQDGSAMDRLLATRFSTGQLVLKSRTREPNAPAVYEPDLPKPPQGVPRPRGIRRGRTDGSNSRDDRSGSEQPKERPPPASWAAGSSSRFHSGAQPG
jgi:integrase